MSEHDPLERAHALSAQASVLLRPSNVPVSSLEAARQAYTDAADLFARSATQTADDGAKRALELLTNQNRRLAKDVERRIAQAPQGVDSPEGIRMPGALRRESESPIGSLASRRLMEGVPTVTGLNPTSIASRLNPAIGIPPFSLRPPNAPPGPSRLSSGPSLTRQNLASPSSPTSSRGGPAGQSSQAIVDSHTLSPLVSSSSSDESYLNLGAVPDTLDPFSRFWGMLDNMLDNISNPVAFATAAVDLDQEGGEPGYEEVERQPLAPASPAQRRTREREASESSFRRLQKSPTTESFYVVPKSTKPAPAESSKASSSRQNSPTPKTPEELALENTSLRSSLDALAVHAQALEKTNQALRVQNEGRERLLKTAISGVRREAHKAKQGQDLMRSQLLASFTMPSGVALGGDGEGETFTAGLQRRVVELQAELSAVKLDNEKKQAQIDKYKDRFDRIKANARAKKESKAKIEGPSAKDKSGRDGDLDEPGSAQP